MSSCTTSFSTKVSPTFRKNDIFLKKQMLGTISFSSKKDSYLGFTAQTSSHTDFVSAMDEDCKLELKSNYISDGYCKELEIAVRAVHMACLLCQRVQENLLSETSEHVHSKEDDSLVTIADWSVQAIVSWVLSEAYGSNVSIVAEEDVEALSKASAAGLLEAVVRTVNECLSDAPRFGLKGPGTDLDAKAVLEAISRCSLAGARGSKFWVLDPVDGTLGFVRGDQYAIALALIEDGEPVLGVLGCPNYPMKKEWLSYQNGYRRILSRLSSSTSESSDRGSVLYARKGGGRAWMQPLLRGENKFVWPNAAREIRVSSIDNPALATFCEPVEKANSSHSFTAGLAHSVGLRNQPLRVYSMVKYAAIARGDAEIYMKFARAGYKEKIWDHAAGVLIIISKSEWAHGHELAGAINYQFPQMPGVNLSVLLPSASEDAINLITSLCSWDPCKRPTAVEVLQHRFFQSCFYVPPSLRSKTAVSKTPPSAGMKGSSEQKTNRWSSSTLTNPKASSSFSPVKSQFSPGVQRKLQMNYQDATRNDKPLKGSSIKQQPAKYRPPARNVPLVGSTVKARVSDAAEKLGNMSIGSGRASIKQPFPQPMKAGGLHGQHDLFLGRSQDILPGRSYSRKVAG